MSTVLFHTYKSIDDMPIYNWFKIHDTGDLKHLLINKDRLSEEGKIIIQRRWKKVYDQYLKRFGFGDSFTWLIEKQRQIALLMIEKAETGNLVLETFIDLAEAEIEKKNIETKKTSSDFFEIKNFVEKEVGFRIDVKQCSVSEFYSYVKTLNKK